MRWIRRLFVLFCLIATCLVIWGAVYARKQGFTQSWRNAIEKEFTKRGYYVEIGKITLGAFRGLVAEDVTFFQNAEKNQPVALLDDVYLDVDLSRILSKQVSVNTLDVQDASLSLPLDPADPNGQRLRVENLSGRVVVTESLIEIVKAEATMADFDLDIKGSLLRGDRTSDQTKEAVNEAESARQMQVRREQILAVLDVLRSYEFLDERPRIFIEFRGDLDDLATTTAKAKIEMGKFRKKGQTYEVGGLTARINYDGMGNDAEIEQLTIRDGNGELNLTGNWAEKEKRLNFELRSTVDISSLAGMFLDDRRLLEVVFFRPPDIEASGWIDLEQVKEGGGGFPGEILGEFQSGRFVTRGTVFAGLDFGFSLSGDRFYVRNLRLDHKTGVAFLNLKYDPDKGPETIQYQSEIKLDPHVFRPFFDEGGRKFIDSWDFSDSSNVYVAFAGRGESWDTKTWENSGVIDLRNFRLNGVPYLEMETDFEGAGGKQWFRNVAMIREEGKIVAEVAEFDSIERLWEVKGVVSTVDILDGAKTFNPKLSRALAIYKFDSPPTVKLSGKLDARRSELVRDEPRRNELSIEFQADSKARYTFLGETIVSDRSKGTIKVDRARVHLTSLDAEVFGGTLHLEYDVRNVRASDRYYEADVRLSGVPLEAITSLYGDTGNMKGTMEAAFQLSGNAGIMSSVNGQGVASISNGNLFAIPLLGPLSRVVAKAQPGQVDEGANVAREARATLVLENGVLSTSDFEALTDSFRVKAAGSISLVDKSVDVEAVVNTKGTLASAVLTPVSELLTFSCTGTMDNQVWKAKHISNLGKVPAQMITELTELPVEGLKKIGQGIFGPQGVIPSGMRRELEANSSNEESSADSPERTRLRKKLFERLQNSGARTADKEE